MSSYYSRNRGRMLREILDCECDDEEIKTLLAQNASDSSRRKMKSKTANRETKGEIVSSAILSPVWYAQTIVKCGIMSGFSTMKLKFEWELFPFHCEKSFQWTFHVCYFCKRMENSRLHDRVKLSSYKSLSNIDETTNESVFRLLSIWLCFWFWLIMACNLYLLPNS